MGDHFSDEDFRKLHRLVQEAALLAYPNPERKGCPSTEVLKEMGALEAPFRHPSYDHVKRCSPCLREILEFGAQSLRQRKKARIFKLTAMAASLLICAGLAFQLWSTRSGVAIGANIDFESTAGTRGVPTDSKPPATISIPSYPRNRLLLTVTLPRGSDIGRYEFEVLPGNQESPMAKASGEATITDGITRFIANIDLTHIPAGRYRARVRRIPWGEWRFLEIEIR